MNFEVKQKLIKESFPYVAWRFEEEEKIYYACAVIGQMELIIRDLKSGNYLEADYISVWIQENGMHTCNVTSDFREYSLKEVLLRIREWLTIECQSMRSQSDAIFFALQGAATP